MHTTHTTQMSHIAGDCLPRFSNNVPENTFTLLSCFFSDGMLLYERKAGISGGRSCALQSRLALVRSIGQSRPLLIFL